MTMEEQEKQMPATTKRTPDSPEPWIVKQGTTWDHSCVYDAKNAAVTGWGRVEQSIYNARRIVACVNYCAGMSFEELSTARMTMEELMAENAQLKDEAHRIWHEGYPPKPFCTEWFIAETTFNDRRVLIALPEEYTYDFRTADETYIMKDRIVRWMQFPDSQFIPCKPAALSPAQDGT